MKTKILFVLILCCASLTYAQYNKDNLKLEAPAVTSRYRFKNLQLYPIRANKTFETSHRGVGRYTTLKEAKQRIRAMNHASQFPPKTMATQLRYVFKIMVPESLITLKKKSFSRSLPRNPQVREQDSDYH